MSIEAAVNVVGFLEDGAALRNPLYAAFGFGDQVRVSAGALRTTLQARDIKIFVP